MSVAKRVSMGLTEADFNNAEFIEQTLNTRTRAGAVSQSLSVLATLLNAKGKKGKILVLDDNGKTQEVIIPGLHYGK